MRGKKTGKDLPYCDRCIYRPCGQDLDHRRFCLVRVMIAQSEEARRQLRKQRKKERETK